MANEFVQWAWGHSQMRFFLMEGDGERGLESWSKLKRGGGGGGQNGKKWTRPEKGVTLFSVLNFTKM